MTTVELQKFLNSEIENYNKKVFQSEEVVSTIKAFEKMIDNNEITSMDEASALKYRLCAYLALYIHEKEDEVIKEDIDKAGQELDAFFNRLDEAIRCQIGGN